MNYELLRFAGSWFIAAHGFSADSKLQAAFYHEP